jgi:hypothetical protein
MYPTMMSLYNPDTFNKVCSSIWNNMYINTMEQSPSSEADTHPTSQEITHLLWNQEIYYCVHKMSHQFLPIHFL